MKVKRLEVQGFKSFKDKTIIHFDQSITGIVGPNGCGKSNIVDAFFWVMGEQSYKHMRGSSSQDLIFNGSTKYSPQGLAEATLVLETGATDREDAPSGASINDIPVQLRSKEISITRRVYRSGEGEYFINSLPARLKDIQELFLDTGVGSKGYSIIEQGQIDKIISSKPEERRSLIEDVAGIAKYKARKRESIRKMEAANNNLSRLQIIISELEEQLKTLERQAKKARKYREYETELLEKETTWGRRKKLVLEKKLVVLKKDKEELEQSLIGIRAAIQTEENTVESHRLLNGQETQTAEEFQQIVQDLSGALTQTQSDLDLSRKRQVDLEQKLESLAEEKTEINGWIHTQVKDLSELKEKHEEAEASHKNLTEKSKLLKEELEALQNDVKNKQKTIEARQTHHMDAITYASTLGSSLASVESRVELNNKQLERLDAQLQNIFEKSNRLVAESQSVSSKIFEKDGLQKEFENKKQICASNLKRLKTQMAELQDQKVSKLEELARVGSQLKSQEDLDAAHEGFKNGPKSALLWGEENNLKVKALADVLAVPKDYEQALEGYLGDMLQNIIIEDPNVGSSILDYLERETQGRAIIQCLAPKVTSAHKSFENIKDTLSSYGLEVLGPISNYVKIKNDLGEEVKKLASNIIENVCLVSSFAPITEKFSEACASILDELYGWSIVSMSGRVLLARGFLVGGSLRDPDATSSVLERKRIILEQRDEVVKLEEEQRVLLENIKVIQGEFNKTEEDQENVTFGLQNLIVDLSALQRDMHQLKSSIAENNLQEEQTKAEKTRLCKEIEDCGAEKEKLERALSEIQSTKNDLESGIRSEGGELEILQQQFRLQESVINDLNIKAASLQERAVGLGRALQSAEALLETRKTRHGDIDRIIEQTREQKELLVDNEQSFSKRIETLVKELAEAKSRLIKSKDEIGRLNIDVDSRMKNIKALRVELEEKSNRLSDFSIEKERASGELAHLVQSLEEKYGEGCLERTNPVPIQEEMSDTVVTLEMSEEEENQLNEDVLDLRNKINRLGFVNFEAIEEFEEKRKRYDYLTSEKSDLEQSIENLQEAIEHINQTSIDRFRVAFESISERFSKLFPIIFGGGRAELSLVYPEGVTDILEAGVDIMAQPPGKKVVNIGLLSGGEKALTAISLIFAIFMVKPSPFCILDEVDAPLDDNNVGKFNTLLRELSEKSQFILITHNKKTMEFNDTLYGVTMEEPGVSKMVSIRLH